MAPSWPRSLPPQTALQESVHERHWDIRRHIILALEAGYSNWEHHAATALSTCSNGAAFFVDPATAKVRPWVSRCHHRMCLHCGHTRSAKVAEQIHLIANKLAQPRLMVLTVASVNRPLRDQLAHLRRSFRKLRNRKLWKSLVTGGVYTIEITRNQKTGLWHPHLNAIVGGKYFPQQLLRKLWHDVTGGAKIVWVAKVSDRQGAARELAKYIGKPQHVDEWPAPAIRDYAYAVNGERLVQTFGDVYGLKVADRDVDEPESADVYRVKISRLVHLAHRGCETPQKLLVLIADRWPQFRSYIYHQLPKLKPPPSIGDSLHRRLALIEGRAPPTGPTVTPIINKEEQDSKIFTAFCRFRADEQAEVFLELEYT